jgi:polyisoprenoid-binding protein YceI
MTATTQTTALPVGTWNADTIHSGIGFSIKYLVSTFGGEFKDFDAKLEVADDGAASLVGNVRVASVSVKDENLAAHMQSPDFFDAEKTPELTFESTAIRLDGDQVVVDGNLTIKGTTLPVEGRGTISGPAQDFQGNDKLGLTLETVVDRTKFGLDWNAPLPAGGWALANDVKLVIDLVFYRA